MKLCTVLIVAVMLVRAETAKILVSQPFGFKSHQNMFVPLIRELSNRGHSITFITNYGTKDLNANVKQIVLDQLTVEKAIPTNHFQTVQSGSLESAWSLTNVLLFLPRAAAEAMYRDERIQQILAEDHYDLVISTMFQDSIGYPLAWHFKTPIILISPNILLPGIASVLGDSDHSEYFPFFPTASDRMNLWERSLNTIISHVSRLILYDWQRWTVASVIHQFMPNCPPFEEIERNIAIVFTNSHPVFNRARTILPQVVDVGAIHCRPPKPLPSELEEFVSPSEAGFIVFSVGSAIKMNEMPEEVLQFFIKAFSRIPQRVIWQWNGTPRDDLPETVKMVPWLPQQDLLGHRNCRLFITHGGLNSLQEAVYHGVPVLGLPFGSDQIINMVNTVKRGFGLMLRWDGLNEEELVNTMLLLLHHPNYAEAAAKASFLLRDQLETPLERAVFWTEHVLRHKGTRHLQLGSKDLAPYQRALVDVYAILFIAGFLMFVCLFHCMQMCAIKLCKLVCPSCSASF